jgi:hypothetical protein
MSNAVGSSRSDGGTLGGREMESLGDHPVVVCTYLRNRDGQMGPIEAGNATPSS